MKVYAYSQQIGLDFLTPEAHSEPSPGLCDVVLRMRAVALNHRDLAIARRQYHVAVEEPLIPVFDGAGEVIAVGLDVTRVRIGELACPTYLPDWIDGPATPEKVRRRLGGPNDGVLAELVWVHQEAVVRAPAHLEALEAACLPVTAVTAWHCLFEHARFVQVRRLSSWEQVACPLQPCSTLNPREHG